MKKGFVLWTPSYVRAEILSRLDSRALRAAWTGSLPSLLVPHIQNEAKLKTGHFTCYLIRTS